eukprot:1151982-Pyramimonas_sp.AAC.1
MSKAFAQSRNTAIIPGCWVLCAASTMRRAIEIAFLDHPCLHFVAYLKKRDWAIVLWQAGGPFFYNRTTAAIRQESEGLLWKHRLTNEAISKTPV